MDPRSPSKLKVSTTGSLVWNYKRMFKIVVILVVIICLLLGAYHAPQFLISHNGSSLYYTVVIDCGSTGSRVNVYEWMGVGRSDTRELPRLVHSYPDDWRDDSVGKEGGCGYHCMQSEPGLDKFVHNTSGVKGMLEPLILLAEKWVPKEKHKETPIFVLGTAGLRRLATEDARQVLDDVEGVVRGNSFEYRKSWVRVLSGEEEAYYGWVALNYRMGSLGRGSSGVLDLGGSSLQVVLEVDDTVEDEHLVRLNIGVLEHRILAYSLSGFGLNEALDRSVFLLSEVQSSGEKIDGNRVIRHPCFGSDFVQNYTCLRCNMLNVAEENGSSDRIKPRIKYTSLKLIGAPDWEQCKTLGKAVALNYSILEHSEEKAVRNCQARLSSHGRNDILNLTVLAQSHGHFHALSGFAVVHSALNLSSKANFSNIWAQGKQLCSRSWAGLSSVPLYGRYAEQRCFQVPYIASLIEDAFCLGNAEMVFGPADVSWTLGAALVDGQHSWLRTAEVQTKSSTLKNMGTMSSPIVIFVILLCLLLIVYCGQIKLPMPGRKGGTIGPPLPSFINSKHRPN